MGNAAKLVRIVCRRFAGILESASQFASLISLQSSVPAVTHKKTVRLEIVFTEDAKVIATNLGFPCLTSLEQKVLAVTSTFNVQAFPAISQAFVSVTTPKS